MTRPLYLLFHPVGGGKSRHRFDRLIIRGGFRGDGLRGSRCLFGVRRLCERICRFRDDRAGISAGCKANGMNYSTFMNGLKKAGITLNRKMLSEIAIADPAAFTALTEQAKAALK